MKIKFLPARLMKCVQQPSHYLRVKWVTKERLFKSLQEGVKCDCNEGRLWPHIPWRNIRNLPLSCNFGSINNLAEKSEALTVMFARVCLTLPQTILYEMTFNLCVCAVVGCWEGSGGEEGPFREHSDRCARGDAGALPCVSGTTRSTTTPCIFQ